MTAADLAARIEAADESQTWEMLCRAMDFLYPYKSDEEFRQPPHSDFRIYRAANAPYDAAMMLVGDGWLIVSLSELGGAGGCSCTLGNPGTGESAQSDHGARTILLAIAAASVRAAG